MGRWAVLFIVACSVCGAVYAQEGVVGDFLAGDLVKPVEGAWAWYDVKDTASGRNFVVRLAIVGEEKVAGKNGYWLELEVVPAMGYRSVYKMLLTGPARNPANIHKMLRREGTAAVEEINLGDGQAPPDKEKEKKGKDRKAARKNKEAAESALDKAPDKKLVGEEDITTAGGPIHATHYELAGDNAKTDAWLNEKVSPMGIVRIKSPAGELMLKTFGKGGPEARSVINDSPLPGKPDADDNKNSGAMKVEVHVDKQPKTDHSTAPEVKDLRPKSPEAAETPKSEKNKEAKP